MNDKEYNALMKKIKESTKRAARDPEYAKKILMSTGMYTKTGKLKKRFRQETTLPYKNDEKAKARRKKYYQELLVK